MYSQISFVALLILCPAFAFGAFEKRPGATNPVIDQGEAFEFQCTPPGDIYVDQKGVIWKKGKTKTKVGPTLTNMSITYLECFLVGDDLVAAFQETTSEGDTGVDIVRQSLKWKSGWKASLLAMNLGPPVLKEKVLTVVIDGGVSVDFDIETGKVLKTDAANCLMVSLWNDETKKSKKVHRWLGSECNRKDGVVSPGMGK